MRKSVGQAPTVEQENKRNKKTCRTSSDIGAEQENHIGSERVKLLKMVKMKHRASSATTILK
jgi:hypothetical protein